MNNVHAKLKKDIDFKNSDLYNVNKVDMFYVTKIFLDFYKYVSNQEKSWIIIAAMLYYECRNSL